MSDECGRCKYMESGTRWYYCSCSAAYPTQRTALEEVYGDDSCHWTPSHYEARAEEGGES